MFSRKRSKRSSTGPATDLVPIAGPAAGNEPASAEAGGSTTTEETFYFPPAHEMLIGDGIEFSGEIRSCARLVVAGSFTGTLHATDVLVLSKASLNAVIVADRVDVFGRVEGEIVAAGNIRFREGSLFDGRLVYRQLLVDPGALLSGELSQYATEDEQAALDQLDAFRRSQDDTISLTGEDALEAPEAEQPARPARLAR